MSNDTPPFLIPPYAEISKTKQAFFASIVKKYQTHLDRLAEGITKNLLSGSLPASCTVSIKDTEQDNTQLIEEAAKNYYAPRIPKEYAYTVSVHTKTKYDQHTQMATAVFTSITLEVSLAFAPASAA